MEKGLLKGLESEALDDVVGRVVDVVVFGGDLRGFRLGASVLLERIATLAERGRSRGAFKGVVAEVEVNDGAIGGTAARKSAGPSGAWRRYQKAGSRRFARRLA